jgi:hypothetical protein
VAISLSSWLTVAVVFEVSLTVLLSGIVVAASLGMVSADSWRVAESEPILLTRLGKVHRLSKPCRAMLRKAN